MSRRFLIALGVGVVGSVITGLGALASPREAAQSWLFGFIYWLCISVGALILLQTLHAARARWPVVCRRPLGVRAAAPPLFAVLFVPIAPAAPALSPGVTPAATLTPHALQLLSHKRPSLDLPFFLVRASAYL